MSNLALETADDNYLVRQFRQFYEDLERTWQTAPPCSNTTEATMLAQQVSRHLENLIELQTLEYRQGGSRFAQQAAQDARYLKVALADEVLLRQNCGGHEHSDLFPAHHGFERGADGDFRFTKAYVAANQPVHRLGAFHVELGFVDGFELVGCFLEDE